MPEPAKPREPESNAPTQVEGKISPSRQEKQDEPVTWPRDMNIAPVRAHDWGSDPEGLRDA